ncbi:MAG TPA: histidine kinase dimerization/phospho-acceptor domain-containing protein [Acidobacteriota bacterium]
MIELDEQSAVDHAESASAGSNPNGKETEEKLRKLVSQYETKIDEVADVITRVRHEINNPLTGVLGQAQLLLREELNEKTRQRVQTIEELAIRLRDIVAQLRQVQKVSKS